MYQSEACDLILEWYIIAQKFKKVDVFYFAAQPMVEPHRSIQYHK